LISENLQTAYAAQQDDGYQAPAPYSSNGGTILTPEIKQQIADEVREQLELENLESQQSQSIDPGSSGVARLLSDGQRHVFVVGSALDVVDYSDNECALSEGDVLALRTPPPPDATAVDLVVLASKGGAECRKSSTVTVQLTDLQEMQNQMRALIDQGLQELQQKQGRGGLPPLPSAAQGQPTPAPYADAAPPLDPNAGAEIQQQDQQADQSLRDANGDLPR
jgi:hypothetical protein